MKDSPLWMIFLVLCFEAAIVATLVPGEWTERVVQRESELVLQTIGREEYTHVQATAQDVWTRHLITSGVLEAVRNHVIPSDAVRTRESPGWKDFGKTWFEWLDERINAMSNAYYHWAFRWALLMTWMPYFAILLVPAIYDGFITWRIKRTNFAYISPTLHQFSTDVMILMCPLLAGLFLAPVVIDPVVIPASMALACVFIGLVIGNTQKRV